MMSRGFSHLAIIVIAVVTGLAQAIYPPDHWNYSTKLTLDNYVSKIQDEIDAGKTVFVRFIASEG